MQVIQKIFSGVVLLFSFSALHAQVDSVLFQRDSVIMPETDLTVLFFSKMKKQQTLPNCCC